jgi:hypothetical protein
MSKGTFFGDIIRNPLSLDPIGDAKKKRREANAARDAQAATKAAEAKSKVEAEAVSQRQTAKQFAATQTPSRGFGSNSLENLSRSFLLRL